MDSDLVRRGSALRKILSRVPQGRPHFAKKSFIQHPKPKAKSNVTCSDTPWAKGPGELHFCASGIGPGLWERYVSQGGELI